MPTHANRDGLDMSKPDTRNLHRHAPGSNPNASEIPEGAEIRGCPDTPERLNGRENANAEAAGGPVTPKPAPGGEMPGGGQFVRCHAHGDERRRLLELAAAWNAAGCVVHPAKADGSKVPMSVAGGGANIEPAVYAATYSGGPRAGQPHPQAGQPHPRAGQHGYGWKRLSTGEYSYPFELTLARLRGQVDGIGLFCGSVSGGLEMFELEGRAAHLVDVLEVEADRRGIREVWDRFNAGCSEWTPSGGIHWMARRTGGPVPGNTKLATRPDPADPKNPLVFAETRGQGGWVVVAGSFGRTHASGKPYVLRTGSPATIPVFTVAEAEAIHALFRTLDEMPEHTTPTAGVATLQRRERPAGELLPGDDFNERATWAEVLPPPWAKISSGSTADAWSMHGQGGRKTADVYHNDNTLFIYDTECPGQGRKLSLFSAYVWLHHSGDFHAAASALYALGFGTRAEKRPDKPVNVAELSSVAAEPPPVRVETFPDAPMVTVDELRASITGQIADVVKGRPALAIFTPGTAAGKTFAACRDIPAAFDRVFFNVGSHDAAAAIVEECKTNGFDAAAIPPVNEHTCAAWEDADAKRLAAQYGAKRPGLAMSRAMAVGMTALACHGCPLYKKEDDTQPPDELAFLRESGWDVDELPAVETSCQYWRQRREAESKSVVVQCQERTRRRPSALAPVCGETVACVTDENALGVLVPRVQLDADHFRGVADAIRVAADNKRNRSCKNRFSKTALELVPTVIDRKGFELAEWAGAVADTADQIVAELERLAEEGPAGLHTLNVAPVDATTAPAAAKFALASMLARTELPKGFNQDALTLVRRVAVGSGGDGSVVDTPTPWPATVHVVQLPNGKRAAHIHDSQRLWLPPGVVHFVLDATAPLAELKRITPDAVVFEPPGRAPLRQFAAQVWQDIRPDTHPRIVVEALEKSFDLLGLKSGSIMLPLAHRRVLLPQTRPRRGTPKDLPTNVDAIANWNVGKRNLKDGGYAGRLRGAKALAARMDALRARMSRDEHGNVRATHMRGTISRGSNTFMKSSGVDGLVVVGFTRGSPSAIVGHLLATDQADAVARDGQWTSRGIAGTLPTVTGGTRDVRWSGYADPAWAAAAEAVNRSELVQSWSRARPNLEDGVPVIAVAAEPCGLPLMDFPDLPPAHIRELVATVERLADCEDRQPTGGAGCAPKRQNAEVGNDVNTVTATVSIGQRCIEHTDSHCIYTRLADRTCPTPGVAMDDIRAATGAPERSVRRWLADAVERGLLARSGTGRWTRYALPGTSNPPVVTLAATGDVGQRQGDDATTTPPFGGKFGSKSEFEIAAAAVVVANADQSQHLNGANSKHASNLEAGDGTANSAHVRYFDDANTAFLEAAAELDDAWEPWLDDTVAAADAENEAERISTLKRHQPTAVWRVVSNEPHRYRSPVDAATTPTTHGQRGGHARPPPGRVGVGNGG
jgi:hypothetical protein